MRILFAALSYPPAIGGAQYNLHCLAKTMKNMGHEVSIINQVSDVRTDWLVAATIGSGCAKKYEYEGINVSQLGFSLGTRARMLPWVVCYYLMMGTVIKRISGYMLPYFVASAGWPSVVHATRIGREFIVRTAMDFAHDHRLPFALTPVHHARWRGYPYGEYDKIYREADCIFALTEAEKEILILEKGVAAGRIHVTGIGPVLAERYSAEYFREKFGIKERFVLFLGQQYRYKGIGAILQAAQIVWKKDPDIKFVFIGPPMNDSRKLFHNLKDRRVVNLGAVDLETKTSALAACEFLCMPSTQESFGGVYVEAWSLRKAVIGGRIPPIACLIDHEKDGLLSSQNPNELAEAIAFLLGHSSCSDAMGNAGWKKVQEKYTWDRLAKKTLGVYKEIS